MNMNDMTNKKCIITDCQGRAAPANERDLCMKCYSIAKKAVQSGRTTWEQLEEMGLVMHKNDPFTKALNKAIDTEGE